MRASDVDDDDQGVTEDSDFDLSLEPHYEVDFSLDGVIYGKHSHHYLPRQTRKCEQQEPKYA